MGRITSRVSRTTTYTKTFEPTMELRWLTRNKKQVLQQAWKDIETGEKDWVDIPVEKAETPNS
jgi:hypothetical protein